MKQEYGKVEQIKKLIKKKKYIIAQKELESYLNIHPENTFAKYQYGILLKETNHLQEAFDLFYEIYDAKTINSYSALYEMGRIRSLQEDYDVAYSCFKKVVEESPNEEVFARIELAKLERQKGNIKEAKRLLREAIKVNVETSKYAILTLANIELSEKNVTEACRLSKKLPEDQNENYRRRVLLLKGKIQKEIGDYTSALSYLESVSGKTKDSTYWDSLLEIAKIYEKQDKLEEALEICKRLKDNNRKFRGDLGLLQGMLYKRLKKPNEARQNYLEVATGKTISTNEAYFKLGKLEVEERNYDKAEEYFKIVLDKKKIYSAISGLNIIYILLRKDEYDKCYDIIAEIEDLDIVPEMRKDLEKVKFYLDVKTNKPQQSPKEYNYTEQQIIDYDKEKAIEYIDQSKRLNPLTGTEEIKTLFDQMEQEIEKMTPMISGLRDYYTISIPDMNCIKNVLSNSIKIACLPNTRQIMTIVPYTSSDRPSEEELEEEKPKQKQITRLSQIDKFNKRYGINAK